MSLQRHLAPSEAYHAFVDWSGSYSLAFEGRIDVELLQRAFAMLCKARPLLRGRLSRERSGFTFHVDAQHLPQLVVREGGEEVYEEEMGRPLDSAAALSRLVLVHEADRGHLLLVLHHSMIDGRGGITLLEQLLRNLRALQRGGEPSAVRPLPFPEPAEELLRRREAVSVRAAEVDRAALCAALAGTPSPDHLVVRPDRIRLSEPETDALLGRLRGEGLSVHAFVSGAATVALHDAADDDGDRQMVCGCPVDLRERVDPPVTVWESTNFVSGVEAGVRVGRNADPRTVGGAIKKRLDAAVTDGEAERGILEAQQFAASEPVAVDLVVTNLGRIPGFTEPDGLRVTDFRGYTTTTMPALFLFVVTSYAGRLSMEMTSPAGHLSERTRAELRRRVTDFLCPAPAPAG